MANFKPTGGDVTKYRREPENTGVKITNGPIWTKVSITTYTTTKDQSPEVTEDDVHQATNVIWQAFLKNSGYLNFTSEVEEHDIYTEKVQKTRIEAFVRHPEDMISVKGLWDWAETLMNDVPDMMGEKFRASNLQVVSREFVRQHHPELV